jgi:hypothetical protein
MAKEAYRITSITSQRSHSSGSDLTMKAAINTPTTPPKVRPSEAPQANLPVWKKRKLATGCSSAQAPIMIGKAAIGCMPSSASVIMQGAYRPMPALISAPRMKLTPTANGNFQPAQTHGGAAARQGMQIDGGEHAARDEQGDSHGDLDRAPRQPRHHVGAEPRAHRGAQDHADEQVRLDIDRSHEDHRLSDGRGREADVEGAGDALVRNHAAQLENGRGGREGSDPQGIEEGGDESDDNFVWPRPASIRRSRRRAHAAHNEGHGGCGEGGVEEDLRGIHARNIPLRGAEYSASRH